MKNKTKRTILLPEQNTINIFSINWTLKTVREICIRLSKVDTNDIQDTAAVMIIKASFDQWQE